MLYNKLIGLLINDDNYLQKIPCKLLQGIFYFMLHIWKNLLLYKCGDKVKLSFIVVVPP